MKKYLIVSTIHRDLKRAYFTTSNRFGAEHPEYVDVVLDTDISLSQIEQLSKHYEKIIFRQECTHLYRFHLNPIILNKLPHTIYLKTEFTHPLYNSCTTGFWYYKNNPNLKNFIPIITDHPKVKKINTDKPCIGFYGRIWLIPDAYDYFKTLISENDVDVCIMGDRVFDFGKNCYYTYDSSDFFSRITHYLYPRSAVYVDVTPHSLIEAVQLNKQIIIPDIPGRNHKDGVDDIMSCIKYHTVFNPNEILDNSETILTASNFKKFYEKIFNNRWEYSFDRNKYKTFRDWIEKEVL